MPKPVYISGKGVVSSIGNNTDEVLKALFTNKHGLDKITYLNTVHKGSLLVGEVKLSNQELSNRLELEDASKHSRTTLLGMLAARETIKNAGLDNVNDGLRTGLISSTTVGGIDKSEDFYRAYLKDKQSGRLRNVISHDCGDSTENIAVDLGIYHYVSTISTACSSSANAMMIGARLIKNNILDRVIVGGTDALTKYTLNGFNALKILDTNHCKPFDQDRNGLNLGEGAAYLLLESEESLKARNAQPISQLLGYGNANDAFHQTASSPEGNGAFNAMSIALKQSGLAKSEIDYINVHGTATPINDLSEGKAMKKLFLGDLPEFSSTKSFTGHTLAAAGSIEAVIGVLAIEDKFIPPNLNFSNLITELNISPVTSLKKVDKLRNIMSNSFGFGGNCASLIFGDL